MAIGVLIIEVLILFVLQTLGISARPNAFICMLIMLFSFSYFIDINNNEDLLPTRGAFIQGYLLRLLLLFWDTFGRGIYVLPNLAADAEMFYRNALIVAAGGETNRGFFCYFLGFIFKYLGTSRLYAQFLLTLFSMVALHFGDKTMRLCLVDDKTRSQLMRVLCILPNFAILSVGLISESIVTMFVAISLFFFTCWIIKGKDYWLIWASGCIFLAMRFHSGVVAVLVAYIFARLVYNKRRESISFSLFNILPTFILLIGVVFIINQYGDMFLGKFANVDSLADLASTSALGGSSYAQYVGNSNNPLNMVIYTVPRIVFFLFSPMPFQWRGIADIIAFFFSSLFYIVVSWRTIRYLRRSDIENKAIVQMLFIVSFAATFVFAWGVSNAGTAARHRDKMIILFGVMYALTKTKHVNEMITENY